MAAEPIPGDIHVREEGIWAITAPAGVSGEELKPLTTRTEAQIHGPIEPSSHRQPCRPPGCGLSLKPHKLSSMCRIPGPENCEQNFKPLSLEWSVSQRQRTRTPGGAWDSICKMGKQHSTGSESASRGHSRFSSAAQQASSLGQGTKVTRK